jgi:hypothetical protein
MKTNFLALSLLTTLIGVSGSIAVAQNSATTTASQPTVAQSVVRPADQATLPDEDAHEKILKILESGHAARVAVQQAQLVMAKVQEVCGATQGQISDLQAAIDNLNRTQLKLAVISTDLVITDIQTGMQVGSQVADVSKRIDTGFAQVQANQQEQLISQIEFELETGKMDATMYLTKDQDTNGKLDIVKRLVGDRINEAKSKGWQTDEMEHYQKIADDNFEKNNAKALSNYRKAYKHIVDKIGKKFRPWGAFVSSFH